MSFSWIYFLRENSRNNCQFQSKFWKTLYTFLSEKPCILESRIQRSISSIRHDDSAIKTHWRKRASLKRPVHKPIFGLQRSSCSIARFTNFYVFSFFTEGDEEETDRSNVFVRSSPILFPLEDIAIVVACHRLSTWRASNSPPLPPLLTDSLYSPVWNRSSWIGTMRRSSKLLREPTIGYEAEEKEKKTESRRVARLSRLIRDRLPEVSVELSSRGSENNTSRSRRRKKIFVFLLISPGRRKSTPTDTRFNWESFVHLLGWDLGITGNTV